jgi:hypothetical protein
MLSDCKETSHIWSLECVVVYFELEIFKMSVVSIVAMKVKNNYVVIGL